jgi:Holliday junction resolvase RusA-like endonuclease
MPRIAITPVAKPRMTRSDKWNERPCVTAYRKFKDDLREAIGDFVLGDALWIQFYLPMPKSWSKKKKDEMRGKPHKATPDLDNLEKGLLDALLLHDSQIWHMDASKFWADEGAIYIENKP